MHTRRIRKMVAAVVIGAGTLFGVGLGTAAADTTIDASSFAYELCGDAAFSTLENDGFQLIRKFDPGVGPFGGGSYDCSTGKLTF